jgi:hypothetical protein
MVLAIAVATLGLSAMAHQSAQPPCRRARRDPAPLRIYIRSGPKTHGPGSTTIRNILPTGARRLTERAIVDGSLHFPNAAEIATHRCHRDVQSDAGG